MVETALSRPARVVVPSRPLDHVYDPVYSVSSGVTHQRLMQKSLTNSIHRVPNWKNLFSELGTFPSCSYRLDPGQRQRQGVQFSGLITSARTGPAIHSCNAGGKDRCLFFNRPLIPFMQAVTTGLVLSPHITATPGDTPKQPTTRTVAVQSVYREESSQTVAYAPDFVFADQDKPPDLFYLRDWLPADPTRISLHEIEELERIRDRRAFQASIPPTNTDSDFHHRMRLLQDRELQDYTYKEADVVDMEKKRLSAILGAIETRETDFEKQISARMEKIRADNESTKAAVLDRMQLRRYNAMRKINSRRLKIKHQIGTQPGRDIIEEYSDYKSKIYAPLLRDGILPVSSINEIAQKQMGAMGKTYQSLVALEMSLPAKCFAFDVHKPAKVVTALMKTRKGQAVLQNIEKISDIIQSMKSDPNPQAAAGSPNTEPHHAKATAVVRPATPVTKRSDIQDNSAVEAACTLLQRLLKGRAAQLEIERGLRDSITLIIELMSPEADPEPDTISAEDSANYMIDYALGCSISRSLNTLLKDSNSHNCHAFNSN